MKNTKKVLSVALAGALAFGSMGAAFAAAPVMDEKTDSNVKEAVERLHAFGIVNGMEDGKYHEEMKVTREQFAKILVEALGLGDAANAAKGSTKFVDVESSRWSSGYVNVAAGQGLLKGYPDGTFRPTAEVSYAEAVTMLVRALGYKDEFLPGSWPGNYVAKAADVKITEDAKFDDAQGKADRGVVALLVDNTLDANVVKVSSYTDGQIKYAETETSLLKDKLNIDKVENVRIVADKTMDDSLDKNEVEVVYSAKEKNGDVKIDSKEEKVADSFNAKTVIGQEATVYMNNDDEIVFAESEKDDKAKFDFVEKVEDKKLSLVKFDDKLKFASTAQVVIVKDGKSKLVDASSINTADLADKYGKFVVKNNEIVYAQIMTDLETVPFMMVTENKDGVIKGMQGTDDDSSINLGKDTSYDGVMVFDSNGNKMQVKDIKEGSVILVGEQKYDGDDYAIVTVLDTTTATGKLDRVKKDAVKVGDKEYDVQTANAYYKFGSEDVKVWNATDSDMEDADDAEVKLTLDPSGRVIFMTSDIKATSNDMYGIVTRVYSESDKVKIFTKDANGKGDEITYEVEKYNDLKNVAVGSVVKFNLNKKGEIAEGKLKVGTKTGTIAANTKLGKNSIKIDGTPYAIDKDATILNAEKFEIENGRVKDTDNFEFITWSSISEDTSDAAMDCYVFEDKNNSREIDGLVLVSTTTNGFSSTDDAEAVYVLDKWSKGEDTYVEYVNSKGEKKEAKLDNGTAQEEEVFVATIDNNGEITLKSSEDDLKVNHGVVTKKSGNAIEIDGAKYTLNSNAIVYDETNKKSTSNIKEGMKVGFVVENGVNIKAIELNDTCKDTTNKVDVESITLSDSTATVKVGNTVKLTATVNPTNATNKEVTFKSSNEDVATVDANGVVTAVKEGSTIITATTKDGNFIATCNVTVTKEDVVTTPVFTLLKNEAGVPVAGKTLVSISLDTTTPEKYAVSVRGTDLELRSDSDAKKVFIAVIDGGKVKDEEVKVVEIIK